MSIGAHESGWIYGLHDPGGEQIMADAGTPGWVVHTVAIGQDPNDKSGVDFTHLNPNRTSGDFGIICRINNGYYPLGTVPSRRYYDQFAQRCANFVAASQGCRIWIIGNEPNYAIERPHGAQAHASDMTVPGAVSATNGDVSPDAGQGPSTQRVPDPDGLIATLLAMWRKVVALISGSNSAQHPSRPASKVLPSSPDQDPYHHGLRERFGAIYGTDTGPSIQGPDGNPLGAPPVPAGQSVRRADAEEIWPEMYADCYRRCRNSIKAVPGHEGDLVLTAAIAPWNDQTKYPGNPLGDWVQYFQDVLLQLSPWECDGIALHTYTHGPEPERISSNARMNPPFQARHYEFRAYRDFLDAVPEQMRDLPVFITEVDQVEAWRNRDSGWVEKAYGEINTWNHMALTQKIACMALYRWSDADKWSIVDKPAVIKDFRHAMEQRYKRVAASPYASNWDRGQRLRTTTIVNLRRSAGYVGKDSGDVIAELDVNTVLEVTAAGYVVVDALNWWPVRVTQGVHAGKSGWLAESDPYQNRLVEAVSDESPSAGEGAPGLKVGELAHTTTVVRLRRTPGYISKGQEDIIADVAPNTTVHLEDGPVSRDQLSWWKVRTEPGPGGLPASPVLTGWMADTAPGPGGLPIALLAAGAAQARPDRSQVRYIPGDLTITLNYVRLRHQPGFMNKSAEDVIADIWPGNAVRILDGPVEDDDLVWWMLETNDEYDGILRGWMADEAPNGITLLEELELPRTQYTQKFAVGDLVLVGESSVRVRREPGHINVAEGDVLGEFRRRTVLHVLGDTRSVDGLPWWRVAGIAAFGEVQGWVAAHDPAGLILLRTAPRLPGTNLPSEDMLEYLARPFDGMYGIGQLWGENELFYRQFTYDGVPLLGHNGIDFLTPTGTAVRATDSGTVATTGFDANGFGNYVLLNHEWGQSVYAHLNRVDVGGGQGIGRGQMIGATGNSGNSTGPHLHFAIRIRPFDRADGWGGYSDPLPYLNPTDVIFPAYLYGNAEVEFEASSELRSIERLPPSGIGEEAPGHKRP